jgi:opacity protein-like surface antigen
LSRRVTRFAYSRGMVRPSRVLSTVLTLLLTAVAVLLSPRMASADIRLTGFGGSTNVDGSNHGTLGAAVTFGGLLGVEFEASRVWLGSLEDFEFVDLDAHLTTYMGNLVLRLPTGPVQPYGSAGVGIVRATGSVNVPFVGEIVDSSGQDVGWNFGGGVYLMPAPNFGFRVDIRRFQTGDIDWEDFAGLDDLPLPEFDFWRATLGVTLKF